MTRLESHIRSLVRPLFFLIFALLLFSVPCPVVNAGIAPDRKLPVVKANSPTVDIQDGDRLLKGQWKVSPEIKLDIFYPARAKGRKKVTFRTDIDSITFTVEPGGAYDFNVLLNNKHLCHTRISNLRRSARRTDKAPTSSPTEIPFTLGEDGKMHIAGQINGSLPLDLLFDTGADTTVLFPSALAKKAQVKFDAAVQNVGFGGVSNRKTSNDNPVEIAGLKWDHEKVLYIEKQADKADGIIGFNIFEDKVVEIDHDRNVITVYDTLPEKSQSYAPVKTKSDEGLLLIAIGLNTGVRSVTDWIALDTGSNATLHLNRGFATTNRLYDTMTKIGTSRSGGVGDKEIENGIVVLPSLVIGGVFVRDLSIDLEMPSAEEFTSVSHIGMAVLKRFNMIVDYPQNQVYVRLTRSIAG